MSFHPVGFTSGFRCSLGEEDVSAEDYPNYEHELQSVVDKLKDLAKDHSQNDYEDQSIENNFVYQAWCCEITEMREEGDDVRWPLAIYNVMTSLDKFKEMTENWIKPWVMREIPDLVIDLTDDDIKKIHLCVFGYMIAHNELFEN